MQGHLVGGNLASGNQGKKPSVNGISAMGRIQFEMRHEKKWRPGSMGLKRQG